MVEICPDCGSIRVGITKTDIEDRIKKIHYVCEDCGHQWLERRLRERGEYQPR